MPNFIRYSVFLPGYIFLFVLFYFPTEWGKSRNVSRGGRQWRARHIFAPIHSIWIYFMLYLVIAGYLNDINGGSQ